MGRTAGFLITLYLSDMNTFTNIYIYAFIKAFLFAFSILTDQKSGPVIQRFPSRTLNLRAKMNCIKL